MTTAFFSPEIVYGTTSSHSDQTRKNIKKNNTKLFDQSKQVKDEDFWKNRAEEIFSVEISGDAPSVSGSFNGSFKRFIF